MEILYLVLFFVLGLIVGSFLNVVIFRFKKKESIVKKRSHCPNCKKKLRVWDLFPVLSFLFLKGKCRYCKKPISIQYPLVELATAILFAALYWKFDLNIILLYFLVVSCSLILIFVIDLKHFIVPDRLIIPGIFLAFFVSYLILDFTLVSLGLGVLIGGGFFLILVLVSKGKAMGMGDVKLGILAGLIIGFPQIILTLFFAFVFGGIISGILLA
ncbi:prepilin peptidase, partial [Patescibacteria group bacterium]